MFRSLFACIVFVLGVSAQDPPAPDKATLTVEVPTFANPTCPIMGKKVSMPLFIDTELGRFYVCCKPCYKKIAADLQAAHKTAYPVVQDVSNDVCPVSGEPIADGAVTITLQGYSFKLCCAACVEQARTHSQITLTKLTRKVKDLGNETCPVSGKSVTKNAFAVVGETIVHLSSPQLVDDVKQDPAGVLEKAKAIAKAQPPKPPHEHKKPAEKAGEKAPPPPGKQEGAK
ncbi:MAG TPA: hypothetical protein VFD82_20160 [Planctomycetota bacterium]|nr:hypothetical protein [Planctomycetota bacterium]